MYHDERTAFRLTIISMLTTFNSQEITAPIIIATEDSCR
jgi:hypothetical protein